MTNQAAAADTQDLASLLDLGTTIGTEAPATTTDASEPTLDMSGGPTSFLADIATMSDTFAAPTLGEHASGRATFGVGFTNEHGYVQALAQGVKAATAESYKSTLRTTYHYTPEQIAALTVTIIAESAGPAGVGVVHTPDESHEAYHARTGTYNMQDLRPEAVAWRKAEKTRKSLIKSNGTAATKAIAEAAARAALGALSKGELMAASVRAGQSAIMTVGNSRGAGQIPHARVVEALTAIGMEALAPKVRSTQAQLGEAMKALPNDLAYRLVEAPEAVGTDESQIVKLRWVVGRFDASDDKRLGEKELIVDLMRDSSVRYSGDTLGDLALRVRSALEARLQGETFNASHLLPWVEGHLMGQWHCTPMDGSIFVPAGSLEDVKAFTGAIGRISGRTYRAVRVASADDIRDGLVETLSDRFIALQGRYDAACAETKDGIIGARAAGTMLGECADLTDGIKGLSVAIGEEPFAALKSDIAALSEVLRGTLDESCQRAAMLDMDDGKAKHAERMATDRDYQTAYNQA